jgi:HEAT repeat protein
VARYRGELGLLIAVIPAIDGAENDLGLHALAHGAAGVCRRPRAPGAAPRTCLQGGYATEALRSESAAGLRRAAAHALAERPHPGALDALPAMQADPDDGVRLTVLHRAARLADPVALPLLRAFRKDTSAMVRDEAERDLGERGA